MASDVEGGVWVTLLNVAISGVSIVAGGLGALFLWGQRSGRDDGALQVWRNETTAKILALSVRNDATDVRLAAMRDRLDDRLSSAVSRAELSSAIDRIEYQIVELRKSLTDK